MRTRVRRVLIMASNPHGLTKVSIKVDNHDYQKLKYPIVLYTMKLHFSKKKFWKSPGKKKTTTCLRLPARPLSVLSWNPTNFWPVLLWNPMILWFQSFFKIPRTKGFFCCRDFGFKYVEPTGIKKMWYPDSPSPPKHRLVRTWQHLESSFLVAFCRPQPKTQNPPNSCAHTRLSELSTLLQQCPTTSSSSLFSPLSELSQYMAFFITASPWRTHPHSSFFFFFACSACSLVKNFLLLLISFSFSFFLVWIENSRELACLLKEQAVGETPAAAAAWGCVFFS